MTGRRDWGLPDLPTGRIIAGNYLRYLRDRAGRSFAGVCGTAGLTHTEMSRIESGSRPLPQKVAETLLAGYGVGEPGRCGFAGFLHETESAIKYAAAPRDRAFDCGTGWPDRLAALEQRAVDARLCAQRFVPGFLRTPGYTARIADRPDPTGLQITRPSVIGACPTVVLGEAVLLRPLGAPSAFAAQMQYVLGAVDAQLIRLRILPLDAAAHSEFPEQFGEFVLPDGGRVYAAEGDYATYYSGRAAEERLGAILAAVTEAALPEDQSREYLRLTRDKASAGDRLR